MHSARTRELFSGRRKMSKPKEGRAESEAEGTAAAATAESADKRGQGRPKMNGENIFICQSKIYTYMSPNKPPAVRPPLQEENSATHHEAKCQSKPGNETYKKDRINIGHATDGAMKSEGLVEKERGGDSPASFSSQKPDAREPSRVLPPESANAADKKPAQKQGVKTKPGPKRKAQGKTQQNRKVTDYYPIRRSSRKSKKELQIEEKKRIDDLIESGKEDGMKIDFIDGKGRGVIATKHFKRGEFVVEYHGDLIEITDAKKREAVYAQDPSTGCYMYYFRYLRKTYCVDATKETHRLGRLINHSKCGNCQTKLHDVDGIPHLILVASRDIKAGEELLYDYGDRSKASLEAYPWLKH
ncbi:N-lysine methyltransferase KMT5A isoform X2 [Rhineura floridana]|uniref:N-lysine methyltransferase KMT5A isoform X2 n=1 Tax=Rhineura floridana TaxID=261503 RepID=UPI002AC88DCB|nr:N-lysine methyltransferase KMT5A isoform X2 [Rhineura floridana]